MTGKDLLTILLVVYNFKKIDITTYRGCDNAQGYEIHAINDEINEYYDDVNCEGLLFNITNLIREMNKRGIEPTYKPFPGYDYPVSKILEMFDNK